jgi:AraC family transcriptional regulator
LASSRRSEHEYQRRMHAVVDYIDRHLDSKLDLATLADVAHFSPFHFHRVFQALMDEALGDYVRRRRMESAAIRLRSSDEVSVISVALAVGFSSAESFTRAFRAYFGLSPTQWRKSKDSQDWSNSGTVPGKLRQAATASGPEHGDSSPMEFSMNVVLIDREPVSVVYLRHTGPYGPGIGKFWWETMAPWMQTNGLFGRDRFGIGLDDPGVTRPERCRYDACVASPEGEVLSGQPHRRVIPGGRYASLAFVGTGPEIPAAWKAILRDWLPKSGLQPDNRPSFEHYPKDGHYDASTGKFSCQICVPVAPL